MSVTLLGGLLLAVSLISVLIYMVALGQLLAGPRRSGLVRTALCRLVAALLYVAVGLLTLHTHSQGPLVGLGVFTVVQVMWQANAVADVRLTRRSRRNPMTDPLVTPPTPGYPPSLPDSVVSVELDKLATDMGKVRRDVTSLQRGSNEAANAQKYAIGAVVLALLLGLTGVIFGLIVFNRADNAVAQSNQNAAIIQQLKDTQTQLTKSVQGQCSLYSLLIGTYNTKARAAYAQGGPIAYDDAFRRMLAVASDLNCGIATPPELPR